MRFRLALLFLAISSLSASQARASLVFSAGWNVSSPRTALDEGVFKYLGLAGGMELRISVSSLWAIDFGSFYARRQFGGLYGADSITFQLLGVWKPGKFYVALGPYWGRIMGRLSRPDGVRFSPTELNLGPVDYGPALAIGYEFRNESAARAGLEIRGSFALNDSSTGPDSHHWNQLQGLLKLFLW